MARRMFITPDEYFGTTQIAPQGVTTPPPSPVEKKPKHHQYMDIVCSNKFGSCSTALIKGFCESFYDTKSRNIIPVTYDLFLKNLDVCMGKTIESLSHNKVSSYSFILASTIRQQPLHRQFFKDFGFDETEEVYNKKNCTHVILHTMSVPKVLARLKELKEFING